MSGSLSLLIRVPCYQYWVHRIRTHFWDLKTASWPLLFVHKKVLTTMLTKVWLTSESVALFMSISGVAYKQQKFNSHISGGWEVQIDTLVWVSESPLPG